MSPIEYRIHAEVAAASRDDLARRLLAAQAGAETPSDPGSAIDYGEEGA